MRLFPLFENSSMRFSLLPWRNSRHEIDKLRAKAKQMKEWFESAMGMVAHGPAGVAWGDAQDGFKITYVNGFGRAMLGPHITGGAETLSGQALDQLFPALGKRRAELADPARLPLCE